jgi:hypothetical protein
MFTEILKENVESLNSNNDLFEEAFDFQNRKEL